jgi:hypothetical protein
MQASSRATARLGEFGEAASVFRQLDAAVALVIDEAAAREGADHGGHAALRHAEAVRDVADLGVAFLAFQGGYGLEVVSHGMAQLLLLVSLPGFHSVSVGPSAVPLTLSSAR